MVWIAALLAWNDKKREYRLKQVVARNDNASLEKYRPQY